MKQKKILITGGTGFIGSNITNRLKKDNDVTVFDLKEPDNNELKFLKGSINEYSDVENAINDFDVVIHLAASLGVINTEENPVSTLDTNIFGTRNVLEACRKSNVKKIIFSSSSEIYGEPIKTPIEEKDRPIPITMYGISKLAAEEYIKSYSKNFGIDYTIFRLFNVYGDRQETAWVVPEFVSRAIKNENIVIHGDGTQIRAFSHVSDVARAFEFGLEKGNNEIINIGNNTEPISIKDLADRVIRISGSKSKINFVSFKESKRNRNEIIVRIPSIDKARKILDFIPSISLDTGLEKVIEYRKSIS